MRCGCARREALLRAGGVAYTNQKAFLPPLSRAPLTRLPRQGTTRTRTAATHARWSSVPATASQARRCQTLRKRPLGPARDPPLARLPAQTACAARRHAPRGLRLPAHCFVGQGDPAVQGACHGTGAEGDTSVPASSGPAPCLGHWPAHPRGQWGNHCPRGSLARSPGLPSFHRAVRASSGWVPCCRMRQCTASRCPPG
jgi:hypothetical protein